MQAECAFCATVVTIDPTLVHAKPYNDALARSAENGGSDIVVQGTAWRLLRPLSRGQRTDLWHVERVRTPTERGILKLARTEAESSEGAVLEALAATGAPVIGTLLPALIAFGPVTSPQHLGQLAVVMRAAPTFTHDLAKVSQLYPAGIDPAIGLWMWRRLLEILRILHEAGIGHHAIEPAHLIVENGKHGLRLVGFGNAQLGDSAGTSAVRASAKLIRGLISTPPPRLSELLEEAQTNAALGQTVTGIFGLHRRLGEAAAVEFGPPRFRPLALPA